MLIWLSALVAADGGAPGAAAAAGALDVHVVALRSDAGKVGCALWTSDDGFPSKWEQSPQHLWCPIANRQATCHFDGLREGERAISCIHDENDNGKLDTGFLGIPKEGVAVSRDAKGFMGPPKYKNAKLVYPACGPAITVTMKYL